MAVCQNGEEYCRRKGDVSDEPNTESAIEFFWGGGSYRNQCICRDNYSAETRFNSVQFSSIQLSSSSGHKGVHYRGFEEHYGGNGQKVPQRLADDSVDDCDDDSKLPGIRTT